MGKKYFTRLYLPAFTIITVVLTLLIILIISTQKNLDRQRRIMELALQEKECESMGSNRTIHVDVRIIAATNRDLEGEVETGGVREDLYYRLNAVPVKVPPLRERREDIPDLVLHFLSLYIEKNHKEIKGFHEDSLSPLIFLAYYRLALKEEKEILTIFGTEYYNYSKGVPMFFPTRREMKRLISSEASM